MDQESRNGTRLSGWHWFVLASLAAMMLALQWSRPAEFVDPTGWIPVSHDSFYHAARVRDSVRASAPIAQWDKKIHWPQGSAPPWPPGYDYLASIHSRIASALFGTPEKALLTLPIVFALANFALLFLVGGALRLRPDARLFLCVSVMLAPLFQEAHSIGAIDHHAAELTCVLACLLAALKWFAEPSSARHAFWAGTVFALPALVSNGLFVLQLPLLLGTLLTWWLRNGPAPRASWVFAASLTSVTLACAAGSMAFWDGAFSFHHLSWFHVYAAGLTSLAMVLLAVLPPGLRSLGLLSLIGGVALVPALGAMAHGLPFLTGDLAHLKRMSEAMTIFEQIAHFGPYALIKGAALSLLLGFLGWIEMVRRRPADGVSRLLLAFAAFAMLMSLGQLRFWYFGIPLACVMIATWLTRSGSNLIGRLGTALSWGLVAVNLTVTLLDLRAPMMPGRDLYLALSRESHAALGQLCAQTPGAVLAEPDYGHFIRYFSDCSVLANNFIMTAQEIERISHVRALHAGSATELRAEGPALTYVLLIQSYAVRNIFAESGRYELEADGRRLARELLVERERLPEGFDIAWEQRAMHPNGSSIPLQRILSISTEAPR